MNSIKSVDEEVTQLIDEQSNLVEFIEFETKRICDLSEGAHAIKKYMPDVNITDVTAAVDSTTIELAKKTERLGEVEKRRLVLVKDCVDMMNDLFELHTKLIIASRFRADDDKTFLKKIQSVLSEAPDAIKKTPDPMFQMCTNILNLGFGDEQDSKCLTASNSNVISEWSSFSPLDV
jgi:hypothetical protein